MNVTRNNIIAVIPTWGPIFEFTFDMRINALPRVGGYLSQCSSGRYVWGSGMIMRLGADGPSTQQRTAQSMAPIVYLGDGRIHICIHNQTNPNAAVRTIWHQAYEVCGNSYFGYNQFAQGANIYSTQDYIGMTQSSVVFGSDRSPRCADLGSV